MYTLSTSAAAAQLLTACYLPSGEPSSCLDMQSHNPKQLHKGAPPRLHLGPTQLSALHPIPCVPLPPPPPHLLHYRTLTQHIPATPHLSTQMDEILASVADQIKNFAVTYLVDISEVPDFNTMYELYDPCTTMFFFRCVACGGVESC